MFGAKADNKADYGVYKHLQIDEQRKSEEGTGPQVPGWNPGGGIADLDFL